MNGWADLEKKFHKYFYTRISELNLADLTSVQQWTRETGGTKMSTLDAST
jgi:hypothetical protein